MGDDVPLSGVIDQLPYGIWIARAPGGELLLVNQVFREIMGMDARGDVALGGYSEPYGIYGTDGQLYPEHRLPFPRALAARAIVMVDDLVIHRGDGRRVNVRAHARPLFAEPGERGDITHVVIAFADITAEVEAATQRRVIEARTRERERLESLGSLAAGVAHDFNNALAQIRILAALLRVREADPRRLDDLRLIEEATDSAAALTRSLLVFGGHQTGPTGRIDLDEVVAAVAALVRRTFDRRIEIEVHASGGGALIAGDRNELEQSVLNLAVNARDVMPGGGRLVFRVAVVDPLPDRVRSGMTGPQVVLEVSDTGPGVAPDLRARVFEPYFTTKRERESPGTGLGLASVYAIVQRHGGTIEVGDVRPHGARFTIVLPLDTSRTAAAAAHACQPLIEGHGLVLVVDDEEDLRRSLCRAIEQMGYRVIEAVDGIAAIALVRQHHAELRAVVLDDVMPVMSGRDAFLTMHAFAPEIPVVITSGSFDGDDDQAALIALGIGAVLPKPFDLVALSATLARVTAGPATRAPA